MGKNFALSLHYALRSTHYALRSTPQILILFILFSCSTNKAIKKITNINMSNFSQAIQQFKNEYDRTKNPELLLDIAKIYTRDRQYNNAQEYTERYIKRKPNSLSGYDFLYTIWYYAKMDSMYIKDKIDDYLQEIQKQEMCDSSFIQIKYFLLNAKNDESAMKILDTLLIKYPESTIANSSAKHRIDEIAIERNDSLRAEELNTFIQKYSSNKWELMGWNYLIYSYWKMGKIDDADSLIQEILAKYKDNPIAINLACTYYLRIDRHLGQAENLMENCLQIANQEEDVPKFTIRKVLTKEERINEYLLTYAQILAENEKYQEACAQLNRITSKGKSADFYYIKGKIDQLQFDYRNAFENYLSCLKLGDERNYWSGKADSAIRIVYQKITNSADDNYLEFAQVWDEFKEPKFTDITKSAGLSSYKQRRIAWGDYNNDGYDDILVNGNVLLKNNGNCTFTEVTESAGIKGKTNGGIWADIDRDGWLDFFATSSSIQKEDRLWLNNGDGTFVDITDRTALADTLQTEGAAWCDIDGDLYPDLYIANYERWQILDSEPDFLFHNNGDRTFTDVTISAGIIPPYKENQAGRGVNCGDYDNDGDLDIFVSNYRLDRNFLWQNQGNGTFLNVAPETGVEGNYVDGWFGHTIGSEWGDFDNDGDLDLVSANLAHPRYIKFSDKLQLLENLMPEQCFSDIRESAGITYDECHSDPSWGDVNGDGYLDLFITSVYPNRRTYLYLNNKNKSFTDITFLAGVRAFNCWGAAYSDFDNDGDLDLLVCSGQGVRLFRNDTNVKNWLEIRILDKNGKTPIIGTRVEVVQNGMKQIREVQGGKGTTNQHSQTLYFGFPKADKVDIFVSYLNGKIITLKNVELNHIIKIVYKD